MATILLSLFCVALGLAMFAVLKGWIQPGSVALVKFILITSLVIYGLVLMVFLIHDSGSKRTISIESRTEHGVVLIKKVKYPTYYVSTQARIIYPIDNPIDYLFLNSDVLKLCYASGLLQLAITVLSIIFLWRFDFDEPFQWAHYNRAACIVWLIYLAIVIEIITNAYSTTWVRDNLNDNSADGLRYQYADSHSGIPAIMVVLIISSLFNLYRQAIRTREEIDLTI